VGDTEITGEIQEMVTEPENQENEVEETTESEKPKSEELPKGVQKRIAKLTAEKYALKEKLRQEKAKNQDLTKEPEPPEPTQFMDQYGNLNKVKYKEAVDGYYEARRNVEQYRQESVVEEQYSKEEQLENQKRFLEESAKLMNLYPDYYQAINQNIWTPTLAQYLYSVDNGAKLAYYLGKNETEAKRIGSLPPEEMVDELESLESRMNIQPKIVSQASPPIIPVDDSKTEVNVDESKMTDEQWWEYRKKERLRKFKTG
jgi:hypothetical protein